MIAGSFVLSRAYVGEIRVGKLRKCAAAVLIGVLDAGYGMHTYGAFSHKMRLAAKCAALLFENIGIFDVRRRSVS